MRLKNVLTLLSLTSSFVYAGGYKIPAQSLNSLALGFSYNAASHGADSSYYNPANMVFNEDKNQVELSVHFITLPSTTYTSNTNSFFNAESKEENIIMPTLHFSSEKVNSFRYGFSITSPYGLTKRWDAPLQKASAEEFTLKTIEFNPTIAYQVNSNISIGAGLRVLHGSGIVKSNSSALNTINAGVPSVARDMNGDDIGYGYNLALSYKPNQDISFGITYRSKVDFNMEGNAKLYSNGALFYDGVTSLYVPLPASLNIGLALRPLNSTTIELNFDRTYWSIYKELDFNYNTPQPVFDTPVAKNWEDSNTYGIGITHQYNENFKLMLGFAIDETPIVDSTIGFELPSDDGKIYSCGLEYKIDDSNTLGLAYLYSDRQERDSNILGGTIKSSAYDIALSYKYNF